MSATHNLLLRYLRRLSIQEDLRLVYPDGKVRRAYWTNIDRTKARGKYYVDGVQQDIYGSIINGRLVPRVD